MLEKEPLYRKTCLILELEKYEYEDYHPKWFIYSINNIFDVALFQIYDSEKKKYKFISTRKSDLSKENEPIILSFTDIPNKDIGYYLSNPKDPLAENNLYPVIAKYVQDGKLESVITPARKIVKTEKIDENYFYGMLAKALKYKK